MLSNGLTNQLTYYTHEAPTRATFDNGAVHRKTYYRASSGHGVAPVAPRSSLANNLVYYE